MEHWERGIKNALNRIDAGRNPVLCESAQRLPPQLAPGDNESEAAMATTDNNLHIPADRNGSYPTIFFENVAGAGDGGSLS